MLTELSRPTSKPLHKSKRKNVQNVGSEEGRGGSWAGCRKRNVQLLCAVLLTALPTRQRFLLAGLLICFALRSDRCHFIGQSA
jgi:hypothetical protein